MNERKLAEKKVKERHKKKNNNNVRTMAICQT